MSKRLLNPPIGCRIPTSYAEAREMYGSSYDIPSTIKDCLRHGLTRWTAWAHFEAIQQFKQAGRDLRTWIYRPNGMRRRRGRPPAPDNGTAAALYPRYHAWRDERRFWARRLAEANTEHRTFEGLARGLAVAEQRVLEAAP